MADIGRPEEIITIEPIEAPAPEPRREVPKREKEKEPVKTG